MLQATAAEETPLTKQINGADAPDPDPRRLRARGVAGPGHRPRRAAPGAVPDRGRVHDRGHPDGAPGDRHGHPVQGFPDARGGRRHREAAPLGRDPRVDLGAQLRQDRHPDDEPDDRRPDEHRRAALLHLRHRLLHRGHDHPGRRPARAQARALPAADGPLLGCRGQGRHAHRRPERGLARRPRDQGRGRSGPDPRAVPAHRDPAVRRGLQAHGHLPRLDRRAAAARSCGPTSRARRTSSSSAPRPPTARTGPRSRSRSCAMPTSPRATGWAGEGLRLMATGRKDFDPATFDPNGDLLKAIDGLTLLALVGITDPPRPAAKAAIAEAHGAGVHVRMITGDAAVTGAVVAQQLGIPGRAITGAEFEALDHDTVLREVDDIGVIGRVSPQDKVHLVDVLREQGHIVAMTGDGVNDAPAIKKADIGIAMGITGTAVTKAAADMILADDNYATIIKAIGIGRNVYDNLLRFIRFQMAACYGYITVFLGSSLLNILGGVPFLPLQTMWLNFTVNVFQGDRPRVREAEGRPHGGEAAAEGPEDPAPPADRLAHRRGARHGRRHPRRDRVGERPRTAATRRADDGRDHVLALPHRLVPGDGRRDAVGLQRLHPAQPGTAQGDRALHRHHRAGDRARHPPERARHGRPDRRAVARVHRRGAVTHRGRGGEEALQGQHGRRRGRGRRSAAPAAASAHPIHPQTEENCNGRQARHRSGPGLRHRLRQVRGDRRASWPSCAGCGSAA